MELFHIALQLIQPLLLVIFRRADVSMPGQVLGFSQVAQQRSGDSVKIDRFTLLERKRYPSLLRILAAAACGYLPGNPSAHSVDFASDPVDVIRTATMEFLWDDPLVQCQSIGPDSFWG